MNTQSPCSSRRVVLDEMPQPQVLLDLLSAGKKISVEQYFLEWDNGYLWFTNPYGVDGILGSSLDLETLSRFHDRVTRGEDYGPIPH